MKQYMMTLGVFALCACAASATTLNIQVGNVTYAVDASTAGDMLYDSGTLLTVLGKQLSIESINRMYVDESTIDPSTVTIEYADTQATVTIPGALARYVDASIDGAHVSIVQSADVSDSTCGEITYCLAGSSADGGFSLEGSYKATLEMRGLNLTNCSGAPLDIQNGKRIELSVKSGTENFLADTDASSAKGCLVCKGHLELKGKGALTISGHAAHALYAKEYIEMKNLTLTVDSAVKDGVNCNQYFSMESGTLTISGVGDDGVQVSFKDDTDREAEDTGSIIISGGTIDVTSTATACKALKADGDVSISGGKVTAKAEGGGMWDADKAKTKAASCIGADGDITIAGGELDLTATAGGGKGISADGVVNISGGDIKILTSGGIYAYVNGREYDNYTGNTDNLDSDLKSSPKGIKADTEVVISGGNINIVTTGNGGEGIESKGVLTIEDGTISVRSVDDCINSSSHMYIKGGDVTVIATGNDGLDSNGNLYISGGTVRAFGASAPECGLDANEESGYSVVFTGGILLAVGGSNSYPSTSASTQAYISGSGSVAAGSTISLSDASGTLVTFTVPEDYKSSSSGSTGGWGGGRPGQGGGSSNILISCPGIASGSSYTLTNGTSTSSVTARLTGGSSGRPF